MSKLEGSIRLLCLGIFSFFWFMFLISISVLSLGLLRPFLLPAAARVWGQGCLKILGVELDIENFEYLASERSIVIFNHGSTLDTFVMAACMPKNATAVGKWEIMYVPIFNLIWWAIGFSFLKRHKGQATIDVFNKFATKMLDKKKVILIAPEGTRSRQGDLLPFKKGAFHLALNAKVPLQPVVIKNAQALWPMRSGFPLQTGKMSVKVCPPISTDHWSMDTLDQHIAEVRNIYVRELT